MPHQRILQTQRLEIFALLTRMQCPTWPSALEAGSHMAALVMPWVLRQHYCTASEHPPVLSSSLLAAWRHTLWRRAQPCYGMHARMSACSYAPLRNKMAVCRLYLHNLACCVQCNGCRDHSFREPILRSSAVGSWTGFLFGLVQDLSHGDSMVDALALAHAQEQRILDAQGRISQLILQVKVRFATTSIKLCAFSHTSTPAAWPSRHFMRQAAHQQHLT